MRLSPRIVVDLLALLILAGYGWTVQHARRGAADPVWTAVVERGELRVGTEPAFRPFAEERDGTWSGYDVELATEIGRRLGLRVVFKATSYDALYDSLAAKQVDLLASALPLAPEQGWRARFTSAYLDAGQVLVASTSGAIKGVEHLGGNVAGAALGSEGDTMLRALRRGNPAIRARTDYETPEEALSALRAGEIDAVITDAISALGLTEVDRRFAIVAGLTFEPYVLAVPVEAYQLHAQIEAVLAELRAENYFAELNRKWFGGRPPTTDHGPLGLDRTETSNDHQYASLG